MDNRIVDEFIKEKNNNVIVSDTQPYIILWNGRSITINGKSSWRNIGSAKNALGHSWNRTLHLILNNLNLLPHNTTSMYNQKYYECLSHQRDIVKKEWKLLLVELQNRGILEFKQL